MRFQMVSWCGVFVWSFMPFCVQCAYFNTIFRNKDNLLEECMVWLTLKTDSQSKQSTACYDSFTYFYDLRLCYCFFLLSLSFSFSVPFDKANAIIPILRLHLPASLFFCVLCETVEKREIFIE